MTNNLIPVKCRTNLDDYDCSRITQLLKTPIVGESVEVVYKGEIRTLQIVHITHRTNTTYSIINPKGEPYLELELHY